MQETSIEELKSLLDDLIAPDELTLVCGSANAATQVLRRQSEVPP